MRRHAPALLALSLFTAACGQGAATSAPATTAPSTAPAVSSPSAAASASPVASAATSPAASPGGSPATGQVEVVGRDYEYEGVPATTTAGTALAFRNEGTEVHEMAVVRKNPGVTESFQELLQLPDEEAFTKVTVVGNSIAAPGAAGTPPSVTLSEAGEYMIICFVPQGTTSMSIDPSAPPTGTPHFQLGMLQEFTVE